MKPSMLQAEWIAKRMPDEYGPCDPDDCLDVLLGTIIRPRDFVADVLALSEEYDEDFRRNNDKARLVSRTIDSR